jgi:hypothetical protein
MSAFFAAVGVKGDVGRAGFEEINSLGSNRSSLLIGGTAFLSIKLIAGGGCDS